MNIDPTIFKAYDIRGTYPDQIDEKIAKRIAQAYAKFIQPKTVVVARDVRLSGPSLQKAVIEGLIESGVNVVDIGAVPTELLYFAVGYYHYDGGIQVSASHNPAEYNGLKMIREGVTAISGDTGIKEIQALATGSDDLDSEHKGEVHDRDVTEDYLDFLAQFSNFESIKPTKIVANANFGLTGVVVEKLLERLSVENIELVKLNFEPDGSFPKGRPDPLRQENWAETSALVRSEGADLAVAWDADGDRCFFFDEKGEFVESTHFAAIHAQRLLKDHPGEKIIYDLRNVYAAETVIKENGGQAILSKVGHSFIKEKMRSENALFAGELSGHYFFREFYFADSGIIAFIVMLNLLADHPDMSLSQILEPYRERFASSGEKNYTVEEPISVMKKLEEKFSDGQIETLDGLSVRFDDWRFNIRPSNTEPLLRLNVEAKSRALCDQKTQELAQLIEG